MFSTVSRGLLRRAVQPPAPEMGSAAPTGLPRGVFLWRWLVVSGVGGRLLLELWAVVVVAI